MRNIMAGVSVLGLLAVGLITPASAHPWPGSSAKQSVAVHQVEWDGCGPRCQEYRREARERERERERRAHHLRWEEGHRYPLDHQPRY